MKKILALVAAAALMLTCAAFAEAPEVPVQTGIYTIENCTGETVTGITITDNVNGKELKVTYPEGMGLKDGDATQMTFTIPEGEDGNHRLTLKFVTESGYEGTFGTLSIEEAIINLLSADAASGATAISFGVPQQSGRYTVYNMTGEKVTLLSVTDNENPDNWLSVAFPDGFADGGKVEVTFYVPKDEEHSMTLHFETESGYRADFTTLHIEEAPVTLLSADAASGATPISFTAPKAE
ncbi:MAG: hypothetical protein IKP22_14700 [Clostridia bacterium]|nr:hypothetical protein [Clostridia bacterium]